MNPLKSPIVRMGIAAIGAAYASPYIINKYVANDGGGQLRWDTDVPAEARMYDLAMIGATSTIATLAFVLLGMLTGESLGTAAAAGPA